jgi:hypothetical protein
MRTQAFRPGLKSAAPTGLVSRMVRHFGLMRRGKALGVGLGKAARRFVRVRGETGLRRAEASLPCVSAGRRQAGSAPTKETADGKAGGLKACATKD